MNIRNSLGVRRGSVNQKILYCNAHNLVSSNNFEIDSVRVAFESISNGVVPKLNVNSQILLESLNQFNENYIQSKSKNTPIIGKELMGKVLITINKGYISNCKIS